MKVGFPGGSDDKKISCNKGDPGSIPGLGRSSGKGNGNPLRYSCLGNRMNRGAWQAIVCGVAQSWTWLKHLACMPAYTCIFTHSHIHVCTLLCSVTHPCPTLHDCIFEARSPASSALADGLFTTKPSGKPIHGYVYVYMYIYKYLHIWQKDGECISLLSCHNKVLQTRWLKQRTFAVWQFWRLEVWNQSVNMIGPCWGLWTKSQLQVSPFCLRMAVFSLCLLI